MQLIKVTNGVAADYSLRQLQSDNPNTSFPNPPSAEILASYDVYEYTNDSYPDDDQYVVIGHYFEDRGVNDWHKAWAVRTKTDEEKRAEMVCSNRQGRQALRMTGNYGSVKSYFAQLPQDQKDTKEIEWEYAQNFERTSSLVTELGAHLGMTDQEIDDLFDLAQTL